MSTAPNNLAERPGSLVQTRRSFEPRIVFFHFVIFLLLAVLVGGLAYRQLITTDVYQDRERVQNQRRVLVPGPRGNIYDRNGTLLVGNRPRFAVVLYLDELRAEFRREFIRVRKNYRATGDKDLPTSGQMEQIARASVVQRYLDDVNKLLHRNDQVDSADLRKHFARQLLLPYTLVDDLSPDEYARLIEGLPVRSPLQVYTSSARNYPYASAAAHTLGYVGVDPDVDAEDFPGEDLTTFKMKGSIGRDGLEKTFDAQLQGEAGGTIFRVDPSGYRVNPPLERRLPVQGKNLITSLDIDLQLAAEKAIGDDRIGGAVALDVRTGEVLVLASKPDYNLADFSPHLTHAAAADIETRQAWINRAVAGFHPTGSTFKIVTAIAGLRSGAITPESIIADCEGYMRIGGRNFGCDNGHGHHGELTLPDAIAVSCDIYFWTLGLKTSADTIAAEARRFHLDQRSGIELPNEPARAVVPDPAWKERTQDTKWFPGDTANMAIGQGYVLESPLNMACFAASVARGETATKPTLIHRADAPTQHSEPIGLTSAQRAAILAGMEGCTVTGTAKTLQIPLYKIPGLRIAGKTGTAQIPGGKNAAWFICFAPLEHPEVAIAVMIEGDTPGEDYGGGQNAAPVAAQILKTYFDKKAHPALFVPAKS